MHYTVPPEARGQALSKYLWDELKLSRSIVRRARRVQGLLVNGRPERTSYVLEGGEKIELRIPAAGKVVPEPIPLQVMYEDAHVLLVDKPAGMVVHPVKQYTSGTLANGVAYHLLQCGEEPVARPVQRLDRNTSGLVLWAKNPVVAAQLSQELERCKLEREYIAFVRGSMAEDFGKVDVPLRRVWGHPVAREAAVGPRTPEQEALLAEAEAQGQVLRADWKASGQRSVTSWQVLRRWAGASMVSLRLETGRTHQIRVHMAYLGYPLLGDELYGTGGSPGRQALHAASLAFAHPVTGERLQFSAPLPADLRRLKESLDRGLPLA